MKGLMMMSILMGTASVASAQSGDLERAVTAYAAAADARDVAALEQASLPDMRISFVAGGAAPVTITRADFVGMLRAGKAGGVPRTLRVLHAGGNGAFATVHVRLEAPAAVYDTIYLLVKTPAGWLVNADATTVTAIGAAKP